MAVDKGRLKFVETQTYDQFVSIGLNGKKLLHRLPLADSCNDEQVHIENDGIKPTREIVQEHNEEILEGKGSIKASPRISSTGGQQQNSRINACRTQKDRGRYKHKGKKPKVTFTHILEKYQN